jgi:hypothetical protein
MPEGSRLSRPEEAVKEKKMLLEKKTLTINDIEAETALVLPERNMMALVTVVITNLLNNLSIDVDVKNNNIAVQVCAVVQALNTILVGQTLECEIQQN